MHFARHYVHKFKPCMAVKRHIETFVKMQIISLRVQPFTEIVFVEYGVAAALFFKIFHIEIITQILKKDNKLV